MSKNLHVATALNGTIFAGNVLKGGRWGTNKTDVTVDALFAVAKHVIDFGKPVELSANGKLKYRITVEEL